ncbi:hypothetical protein N0V84_007788 [Fusarium piperis]|uniref:Uncharacterized protein n=1 Tax=Fusarium piperis TaxID=1435070 RepID=A0A9W9BNA9_9HYPO|nr:hypothetical protein N0V84_007788 [Fusarium piperis]
MLYSYQIETPLLDSGSAPGTLDANGIQSPTFGLNIASSVSMGLVVVYSVLVVFPINDILLDAHSKLINEKKSDDTSRTTEEVRSLAAAWKSADLRRTLLATFAALAGLVAAYKR